MPSQTDLSPESRSEDAGQVVPCVVPSSVRPLALARKVAFACSMPEVRGSKPKLFQSSQGLRRHDRRSHLPVRPTSQGSTMLHAQVSKSVGGWTLNSRAHPFFEEWLQRVQPLITTDHIYARQGVCQAWPAKADLRKCDTEAPDVDIQALRDKVEASIPQSIRTRSSRSCWPRASLFGCET